jgi:hypothetical protein
MPPYARPYFSAVRFSSHFGGVPIRVHDAAFSTKRGASPRDINCTKSSLEVRTPSAPKQPLRQPLRLNEAPDSTEIPSDSNVRRHAARKAASSLEGRFSTIQPISVAPSIHRRLFYKQFITLELSLCALWAFIFYRLSLRSCASVTSDRVSTTHRPLE